MTQGFVFLVKFRVVYADWSIKIDSLVKTMLVVVTSVSSLVHLYSIGYMDNDHNWEKKNFIRQDFFHIYRSLHLQCLYC